MATRSSSSGTSSQAAATVSRRGLFGGSSLSAGSSRRPVSSQAGQGPDPGGQSMKAARELFIARHATQGFSMETLHEVRNYSGGAQEWIRNQLGLVGSIDDSALDTILNDGSYDDLRRSPQELFGIYGGGMPAGDINAFVDLVQGVQILRSVRSKRQLHERLVEFWTDHFNVWINKDLPSKIFKPVEDRDVIRPHATGKFRDLLQASAKSAAMSHYLSGDQNTALSPNENYGREVMELHTLGVDVLYQEVDVVNAAKLFSGWAYVSNPADPLLGDFQFRPAQHSTEVPITVLGVGYFNMDVTDGEQFLSDLAVLAETAEFVCGKLVLWLLGRPLPSPLHDQVVTEFMNSGGDIALTVAKIFSEPMVDAILIDGTSFKRPGRVVVGLARQLNADLGILGQGAKGLGKGLQAMGQLPYDWAPPTGYPISEGAWGADVYGRWSYANGLLLGLYGPLGASIPDAEIDAIRNGASNNVLLRNHIEQKLLGSAFATEDHEQLLRYIDDLFSTFPNANQALLRTLTRDAIVFAASLPSYQFD